MRPFERPLHLVLGYTFVFTVLGPFGFYLVPVCLFILIAMVGIALVLFFPVYLWHHQSLFELPHLLGFKLIVLFIGSQRTSPCVWSCRPSQFRAAAKLFVPSGECFFISSWWFNATYSSSNWSPRDTILSWRVAIATKNPRGLPEESTASVL